MSVEFTRPAGAQYIDFGTTSTAIGLTSFSISFWTQAGTLADPGTYFLIWDGTGTDSDQYISIHRDISDKKKFWFLAHFSTANGTWKTSADQLLSIKIWYHIVITFNGSSATNNPVIYINGSSVAITETATPSGTFLTGTTANLYLGDTQAGSAHKGRISDVRVYNTILSAAQVLALYNDGVFTPNFDTNLVFNAPLKNATALSGSDFDSYVLTSSQKLIDRINCVEGSPTGSPVGSDSDGF